MSRSATDIIVLAPEGEIRRGVLEVLPQAACYDSALEALADLAAGSARTFIATPAALAYRHEQILSAVRSARPGAAIYLVCAPQEEAVARSVKEADDYFLCPYGLDELAARATEQARAAARPTVRAGGQAERPAHPGASRRAGIGASGPAAPDTSAGVLRAVQECLRAIAGTARHSAAEIAQAAVNSAAGLQGISAAAMLDSGRPSPVAASADATGLPARASQRNAASQSSTVADEAGWASAAKAMTAASLPRDHWVRVDDRTWLYSSSGPEAGVAALAVRSGRAALPEELLDGLAVVAQVALALMAAARDRQAALQVLSTDAETGLASRRYFEHYLWSLCRRAAQMRREVTLVLASPAGDAAMARLTLHPLAELMKASFPGARPARADETTLAAVMAHAPGGAAPGDTMKKFLARIVEAALPLPVAIGAASFPWQASDAGTLLAAAANRLAKSRARGGQPVIS